MGFGSATKKISKVADMAEEVYRRLNELRAQVQAMQETVRDTHDRVERLEVKVDQQTAVIEALAEREGVDVERIRAEAAIEEAEEESEGREGAGQEPEGREEDDEPSGAEETPGTADADGDADGDAGVESDPASKTD